MGKITLKIKGMDKLDKLVKNVQELEKPQPVSFEKLFTNEFMVTYTKFDNIQEFFDNSPFKFENKDEFKAIPDDEIDRYTLENSEFSTWEEMLRQASKLHVKKLLLANLP